MVVKEIGLKELTTVKESLDGLAGGQGTLGTINQFVSNINELLKNGLTFWKTIAGQQAGNFPAIGQQPTGTQVTTGNPTPRAVETPVQPTQSIQPVQLQQPQQGLNADGVFKSIESVLGLLATAKPKMTVKELLNELKTNKEAVIIGIQKGMGEEGAKLKG